MSAQIKRHRPDAAARRPSFVQPMRRTLAAKPFSDPAWVFELKLDGWRALCFAREGRVHLLLRRRNSLSERFPELRDIGELIKAKTALIGGEVVALDRDGLPRFDALRSRRRDCSVVLYAFDLLYLDGYDLTDCPLIKRKALLKRSCLKTILVASVNDHVVGKQALFEKLEGLYLEGIRVSVHPGLQSPDWLKVRTTAGRQR